MTVKNKARKKSISKDDILSFVFFSVVMVLLFSMQIHYHSNTTEHIKSILSNSGVQVNDATFTRTNLGNVYKSSEPLVCEDGTVNEYWLVSSSRQSGFIRGVYPYTGDISKIIEK